MGLAEHLHSRYPGEPTMVSCIIEEFEDNELEKKYVSWKSVANPQEASEDMDNHIQIAAAFCRIEQFFVSPIGVICVALVAIVSLLFICCCCICNKV